MTIRRAIPVVATDDPLASRAFYEQFLGFDVVMEHDGFLMFASPIVPTTQVIVCWSSPTAFDPEAVRVQLSIDVADVDAAHADAVARGLEIVYPLTNEPFGRRRFFVREASGLVVNVSSSIADLAGLQSS